MKDKLLRILSLVTGILMILGGLYALFHGRQVVGTISGLLGICALIAGAVLICIKLFSYDALEKGGFLMADGIILVLVGILLMNTSILRSLGKLVFIVIGLVLAYNAVQSLIMALSSKKNDGGWFVPRIVFCVLMLLVGIWVFMNAGKAFDDVAGIVIGVFFIVRGANSVSDWIGREKYRKNFSYLD